MKPPAFQFYPDDFIGGTATMTHEERGFYILALCAQWSKGGISEDEFKRLGRGLAEPSLSHVLTKFERASDDGMLRNRRLESERAKQSEFRAKQALNGAKRWPGHAKPQPSLSQSVADAMPNVCSPSPSPSPSPKEEGTASPPVVPERKKPKAEMTSTLPSSSVIPLPLDTENFRAAWSLWLSHLKAKRKPPTIHAQDLQLHKLSGMGVVKAIETIHHCIEHNWQGIFPKEERTFGQQNQSAPIGETQAQRDKRMILEACR